MGCSKDVINMSKNMNKTIMTRTISTDYIKQQMSKVPLWLLLLLGSASKVQKSRGWEWICTKSGWDILWDMNCSLGNVYTNIEQIHGYTGQDAFADFYVSPNMGQCIFKYISRYILKK